MNTCLWCEEEYDPEDYEADDEFCSKKCRDEFNAALDSHEGEQ